MLVDDRVAGFLGRVLDDAAGVGRTTTAPRARRRCAPLAEEEAGPKRGAMPPVIVLAACHTDFARIYEALVTTTPTT